MGEDVDHLEATDPYRQEVEEVKTLYSRIASEQNGPCPPVLALLLAWALGVQHGLGAI